MLKNIMKYIKENKKTYLYIFLFSLITWGLSYASPYLIGKYIDCFTSNNFWSIYLIIKLFVIISLLEIIFTFIKDCAIQVWINKIYLMNVEKQIKHLKRLPLNYFKDKDLAYLSDIIAFDEWTVSSFIGFNVITLPIILISVLFSMFYTFKVNIVIGIILSSLIPVYFLMYKIFKKYVYKVDKIKSENISKYFSVYSNQLFNIKSVKLNAWFEPLDNDMKDQSVKVIKSVRDSTLLNTIIKKIDLFLRRIASIILLIYSYKLIASGKITIGEFTIINTYFALSLDSLSGINSFFTQWQTTKVSMDRKNEIINSKIEINGTEIVNKINEINMNNINFKYDNSRNIISNFNCIFEKGKCYSIVGINGSGKSTLIGILLGVIQDYSGSVKINDVDTKLLDMYFMRSNNISVIEQEPILLQKTLLENLTYNIQDYDSKYLEVLCEKFDFTSVINKLSLGLKTEFTEKTMGLSGGEKQKVAIIRALLRNPEIIIMDEPTSALDKESCNTIKEIIKEIKKDKIIIIITHDNNIKNICDEVIELNVDHTKEIIS